MISRLSDLNRYVDLKTFLKEPPYIVRIDNKFFLIEYIHVSLDYGESNKKGFSHF